MAAKFEQTRKFKGSKDKLFKYCKKALKVSGFKIKDEDEYEGMLKAKSGMNLRSWGEKIKITISDEGDVTVKSECALPTQITSLGKNEKNVNKFFSNLREILD